MNAKPKPEKNLPQVDLSQAEGYVLEEQIGFMMRRAHQRASDIFNDVMGPFEVTPQQFAVLSKLVDNGPVSQNLLGRMTAMDPATIFGVIGRLVKRGLVQQSLDAQDARLVIVSLTPRGEEQAQMMRALGREVSRRTLEPLAADEAATLLSLIGRIA